VKKDTKSELITIRVTPEEMRVIIQWGKAMSGLVSIPEAVRDMIKFAAAERKKR
jgi:hypothetical protein